MNSRYEKREKKEERYSVSVEMLIERLKKARALNCNPHDIGIDSFVFKTIARPNLSTKIL